MKSFYKIICAIILLTPGLINAQCLPASPYAGSGATTQTTAEIWLNGESAGGTYYLEYGLFGFTPGTGGTAGTGGTLIPYAQPSGTGMHLLTGLTPNTLYHFYCRKNCSGVWSNNSAITTSSGIVHTAFDCNAALPIVCNTMNNFTHWDTDGAWPAISCPPSSGMPYGTEVIYSFTPTISGSHKLYVPSTSAHAVYRYKQATGPCNMSGWTCIGQGPVSSFPEAAQYLFGPLTAGVQYYILVDKLTSYSTLTTSFRIECPNCPEPMNVAAPNVYPTAATITWTNSNFSIVEWGPAGFVPGTGAAAGVNGTFVFVSGNTFTINGLTPSTGYDVYVRTNCTSNVFGPNSNVLSFATKQCPWATTYPSTGSPSVQLSFSGLQGNYDHLGNCISGSNFIGEEQILRFTAPSSGYFEMTVNNTMAWYPVNYQVALSQNCGINGAVCLAPSSILNANQMVYPVGPLTAGITYDLIFDIDYVGPPIFLGMNMFVEIKCPLPALGVTSNIQPNQVTVNWGCSGFAIPCQFPPILEYGPTGYTPGTGLTAGTNGTLVTSATSPVTITGLTPNTTYDLYIRTNCGGMFSANAPRLTFKTALDCNSAPPLSCGSYFSINTLPPTTSGVWNMTNCGNNNLIAQEVMYNFTPTQSGVYFLNAYGASVNNTTAKASVFIKSNTLACTSLNWSCIGTLNGTGANFVPTVFSLGTLNAGETYNILVDGQNPTSYFYSFRFECSNVCNPPLLTNPTAITYTSAIINGSCPQCTGTLHLEYGVQGFVPGSGSSPGTGGTMLSNVTFPVTVTGLTAGTTYDFYVRQDCGAPSGFSPNSVKRSATPCLTSPSGITSNVPGNTICPGGSITLTQVGGALPPGGVYNWHINSCSGTFVGTGSSITVSPVVTTTYRVKIVSTCGTSNCDHFLTVTVNTPPATITPAGPTTFCTGGNVLLNANTGTGLTYAWNLNGSPIGGAITSSYTASASGSYSVTVTQSGGCSITSAPVIVTVNPIPTVSFTGLAASYQNIDPAVTLIGSPAGGTFTGPGISGNTFSPLLAGIGGPYTITYSYTAGGCSNSASQQTTVTACIPPLATITPAGPTSFCTGGNVVLNSNTGAGLSYVWKLNGSPIGGAINSSYTASNSGSYNVTVTNTGGCSNSSSPVSVTVNPIPTVSFTGLAASYLNTNPAVTLTGSPSGGTFSGTGISGNTFNPSTAGIGGPYTILYSYTDGNGCSNSSSQQTTVVGCIVPPAQPGTISTTGGAVPVCPGDSKSYSISPVTGATSYTWTAPIGGSVASGQGTTNVTINYTAGFTAPDTLRVVAVNTCGTSAQRKLSIQRNLPAIPGAITGQAYGLCNKTGVPFSVVAVAGFTNNWSFNTGNATVVSGQGTNSITANFLAAFTTTAVLTVTAVNGCGTSGPRTLTVRAVPATPGAITGALTVCANQSGVPYSITPVYGAANYTWTGPKKSHVSDGTVTSNNTTLITTASSVTVNYGNSGGDLKVRANNSCASSAYSVTNIIMNCRVSGQANVNEIPEVLIFPNPANDEINISISNYNEFEVEIMNMLGEKIHFSKNTTHIDLTTFPAGMYLMQITCGEHIVMEKFIVE